MHRSVLLRVSLRSLQVLRWADFHFTDQERDRHVPVSLGDILPKVQGQGRDHGQDACQSVRR